MADVDRFIWEIGDHKAFGQGAGGAQVHNGALGLGMAEARDLLIPQLRKLRVGWNGNFGISNEGLAYNSKLAYEMLKAILYACRQGDGTVLKVTDEPLMYAPGKSNIHAL